MNDEDFYIGYLPKAPKALGGKMKLFIVLILAALVFLAYLTVASQNDFDQTRFDYGKLTTLKGVVALDPVPRLILDRGIDLQGNQVNQSILLVNFGKSGVLPIFQDLSRELDLPIEQYEFEIRGTLIYGEGKTVFELTEEASSIISFQKNTGNKYQKKQLPLGEIELMGELIDSKCYFGVMKPGYGKVHRSCAIRCIAGGVTPVLMAKDKEGRKRFILLINDRVASKANMADLIGKNVTVPGKLSKMDDWLVLQVTNSIQVADYNQSKNIIDDQANTSFVTSFQSELEGDITICQ